MPGSVTQIMTVPYVLALALVATGCTTPPRALRAPAEATQTGAEDGARVAVRKGLVLARSDAEGQPLTLRCVLYASGSRDPLAIHDSEEVVRLDLVPGRYRVLVYADPGPFGFDVLVTPERPDVAVQIFSGRRAHLVVTETNRAWLGGGVSRVERQVLGFGWGEPPVPADRIDTLVASARQARQAELRRQAAGADAAPRLENLPSAASGALEP